MKRPLVTVILVLILLVVLIPYIKFGWQFFSKSSMGLDKNMKYIVLLMEAQQKATNSPGEAETVLRNAIAEYPDRYEAYIQLGLVLEETGETNAAYANFVKANSLCGSEDTNAMPLKNQLIDKKWVSNHLESYKR